MKIEKMEFIDREFVRHHRNYLFLFGDNLATCGFGGQARDMRGEPNAIGVATKIYPDTRSIDYFNDALDWNTITRYYDLLFIRIRDLGIKFYDKIIIPEIGLGTGYSKMQENCPKLLAYLNQKLKELEQL